MDEGFWKRLTDWDRSPVYRYLKIQNLIQKLYHWHGDARRRVAWELGEIGEPAVPALVAELKYKNSSHLRDVALALAWIGEPAVPALFEALKDKDRNVRVEIIIGLRDSVDNSVVPVLIEALKDGDHFVRYHAARALGEIRDVFAAPALIEALKDDDETVRGWAAEALDKIEINCKTLEELEEVEKGIEKSFAALRKERVDKSILIDAQVKIAKMTREIAERKNELAPKRDLLLDDKPKPPKKGGKVYRTMTAIRR